MRSVPTGLASLRCGYQFFLYLLWVVVLGLVTAPAVYFVAGGGLEFHKLVFRCMELGALLCAYVWLRLLGVSGATSWGLQGPLARWMRDLWYGWLWGAAMLLALVVMLFLTGARELTETGQSTFSSTGSSTFSIEVAATVLTKGLLVGLAVATVEELWFRGASFTALGTVLSNPLSTGDTMARRSSGWAATLSSLLYAAVHFVRPDQSIGPAEVQWWSGGAVLSASFGRFAQPGAIIDSFVALFAAGMVLSVLRVRTRRIALCIGVHSGWVMVISATKKISVPSNGPLGSLLAGKYDGCDLDLMFGFSGVLASRTDRASPKIVATDLGSASTNVDSIQSPHPCLSSASPIGTSAV